MAKSKESRRFWLMKTEPDVFSIDDLLAIKKNGATGWEGVRNYQARNLMRDEFKVGDGVLIYHSNAGDETGVVGIGCVASEAYPDKTALEPKNIYFDEKSRDAGESRWVSIDIRGEKKFSRVVTLAILKQTPGLESMLVIKRGMRLSVQPVKAAEWDIVVRLGK